MPYSLTFEYITGEENLIADALSRHPCRLNAVTVVHSMLAGLMARIKLAARNDPGYQTQFRAALSGEATDYFVEDGLLVKEGGLVVVPDYDELRTLLISEAHDPVYSGHFGFDKTLEKLRRTWHWPGMVAAVRWYIRSCPRC